MINEIKQELDDFVYPDDLNETLEKLRSKPLSRVNSILASDMLEYLTTNKKIAMIHACANDDGHKLQDSCRGLLIAIQSGFSIDLSKSGNSTTLSGFVPDIISLTQANEIVSKATIVNYPFENVTMQQLRQARGIENKLTISNWIGQRFIRVTVSSALSEPVRPVLIKTNSLYEDEPMGFVGTINKTGVNVLDISKLSNAGMPTDITIELGASNNFTAELI